MPCWTHSEAWAQTTFDITITNRDGEKVRFRRGAPLDNLRCVIPRRTATGRPSAGTTSLCDRTAPAVVFIQLDDLSAEALERVQEVAFLGLRDQPAELSGMGRHAGSRGA